MGDYRPQRKPTPEVLDLLRRLRNAGTPMGGYPPFGVVLREVAQWLAEFGLTIDDDPDEFEQKE